MIKMAIVGLFGAFYGGAGFKTNPMLKNLC